jgi:hypothetical protein
MVHVPYKSSAESLNAILAGQGADIIFENLAPALPHIKAGKLRALGVTSEKRSSAVPDVPAIAETLPGFGIVSWQAIFAPGRRAAAGGGRLSAELIKAVKDPDTHRQAGCAGHRARRHDPGRTRRLPEVGGGKVGAGDQGGEHQARLAPRGRGTRIVDGTCGPCPPACSCVAGTSGGK